MVPEKKGNIFMFSSLFRKMETNEELKQNEMKVVAKNTSRTQCKHVSFLVRYKVVNKLYLKSKDQTSR